jgi:hypothetical protein
MRDKIFNNARAFGSMHIANLTLVLLTAWFCGCAAPQHPAGDPPTLHRREVNQNNPGGKDLVMTFEELQRDEKTSTVKVTHGSGASVPSIMFVVRGMYDIAQARGASHFILLKEWEDADGGWMYLAGFSRDENVDLQKYFGLSEPLPNDKQEFMAVKDYDLIFKARQ